jgi:2-C-methyl-D-erythritol 4-phosphate cytidylyltransferase
VSAGAIAAAVVVAAGSGARFGNSAKVLARIGGRPLLAWVLDAIEESHAVRESIVVTGTHTDGAIGRLVGAGSWSKPVVLVSGGATRQRSVMAGVRAVPADLPIVLVHDGARPLVEADDFDRCAEAATVHGGAIVATPVPDTLKRVHGGVIVTTVARDELWAAQTPQGFARNRLIEACAAASLEDREFTDEASIFEFMGWPVAIVPGSRVNLKITHPEDLEIANAILIDRRSKEEDTAADDA